MPYIRNFPEIAKWPKFRGHFGNLTFQGPSGANFEKCSTRKLFVSEKRVQRKWNRDNRSSFGIFRAETRNFSRIEPPNWNRVTGFRNRTLSNTTILHKKNIPAYISSCYPYSPTPLSSKNQSSGSRTLDPNRSENSGCYKYIRDGFYPLLIGNGLWNRGSLSSAS